MLLCVLFWDWRIGLLALAGMLVYLALLSGMEKQSAKIAPKCSETRPGWWSGAGTAPGHECHQVL
mgnify:CR=1 FL=1